MGCGHFACGRGEAVRRQLSGYLVMFDFHMGLFAPKLARRLPLLVLVPSCALAQSSLDPIVVIGTREPQALARSSADIVRIDAETIRNSSADSVEGLLRREAGLQLARNGGPGQSSGYFLRGAGTSGTVILIDGVRVGSATLGQAEFEALSLAQIDHIEVLRGPASSLYGADAVGGVIHIFTKRGEGGGPHLIGNAAVGGYDSRQADVGVSGTHGAFDYAAAIGHERSRGVSAIRPNDQFGDFNPDDDGYARSFGNIRLGYTPAPGHRIGVNVVASRLNAQYDSAEFNPPDFIADPSPDFRNHLKTSVVAIDYRGTISSLWTTTLQASHNVDDSTSGGTTTSRFKTEREQATWQNALKLAADQQLVLAYEYLHEEVGGDVFTDGPQRRNNAVFAGYSGGFGPAQLEASLRHDDNSAYGGNTTGNLGASYEMAPGLRLRARAGRPFARRRSTICTFPASAIRPEARARRRLRDRRELAVGNDERGSDPLPQPGQGPDHLGLELLLRHQRRPGAPAGSDDQRRATVGRAQRAGDGRPPRRQERRYRCATESTRRAPGVAHRRLRIRTLARRRLGPRCRLAPRRT
jgi:vitamin B12 transporter